MIELFKKFDTNNVRRIVQENLRGRSGWASDESLRYHHSRITGASVLFDGLVLAVISSDAQDYHNTKRGFTWHLFNVFGEVIVCSDCGIFRTATACRRAMNEEIAKLNPFYDVREATKRAAAQHDTDLRMLNERVDKIERKREAA